MRLSSIKLVIKSRGRKESQWLCCGSPSDLWSVHEQKRCCGSKPYGQYRASDPCCTSARRSSAFSCNCEWVEEPPSCLWTDCSKSSLMPPVSPSDQVIARTQSPPPMEERDRSQSPGRSYLPPTLHRHLRSAPQSSHRVPAAAAHTPAFWSGGGQRSTTDPAFYTYPPPLNTSREPVVPHSENKQAETSPELQIDVHQDDTPIWDESFPHPHRIGHAESYTRADDSSWGGGYSARRVQSSDWRPVPLEQYEGYPLPSRTFPYICVCVVS